MAKGLGSPPSTHSEVAILLLVVLRNTSGGLLAEEISMIVKVPVIDWLLFWIFIGGCALCESEGGVSEELELAVEDSLDCGCCWRGVSS